MLEISSILALVVADQGAAFVFLRQGVVVADLRHRHTAADVAGPLLEDGFHLALEQRGIEIA